MKHFLRQLVISLFAGILKKTLAFHLVALRTFWRCGTRFNILPRELGRGWRRGSSLTPPSPKAYGVVKFSGQPNHLTLATNTGLMVGLMVFAKIISTSVSLNCVFSLRILHPLGSDDLATFVAEQPAHMPLGEDSMPKQLGYRSYSPAFEKRNDYPRAEAYRSLPYESADRDYAMYPALFKRSKFKKRILKLW